MKKANDIFIDLLPSLDLHGYDAMSAIVATDDFIEENIVLKNKEIIVIHGIGEGILKKAIHESLKNNKKVMSFYLLANNPGCTKISIILDK